MIPAIEMQPANTSMPLIAFPRTISSFAMIGHTQLVDSINQNLELVGFNVLGNTMPQIEYMSGAAAESRQYLRGLGPNGVG